jgi:hypothetical protein
MSVGHFVCFLRKTQQMMWRSHHVINDPLGFSGTAHDA